MFTELHGNLPLVQIKRGHARQFREALQDAQEGVTANCSTLRYPNSQSGDADILMYRRSPQAP
jgi:hypothetical protein